MPSGKHSFDMIMLTVDWEITAYFYIRNPVSDTRLFGKKKKKIKN